MRPGVCTNMPAHLPQAINVQFDLAMQLVLMESPASNRRRKEQRAASPPADRLRLSLRPITRQVQ